MTVRSGQMPDRFRYTPPVPQADWIDRPRLLDRLARRFEVAALLVIAPAGFGKTTLLSQAIAASTDDPTRVDIWVQCHPLHEDADTFGRELLRAAGATVGDHATVEVRRIADALGRLAPAEVCLVIDDVHLLAEDSSGMALLDELLEALPHNAHLLLSGRSRPPLRLARLHIQGQLETLGSDDLRFDDHELAEVLGEDAGSVAPPADDTARWPAMVSLTQRSDPGTSVDYLLQEIATNLSDERRAAITALCLLDEIDDAVAAAATDGAASADELLGDLPLVHRSGRGGYRLHDLWRQALAPEDRTPFNGAVAAAIERIATHHLDDDAIAAATLYSRIGHRRGVEQAASTFAAKPYLATSVADLRTIRDLARDQLGEHPISTLLDATFVATGDELSSAGAFEEVARHAHDVGHGEIEALAVGAAVNMWCIIDPERLPAWLTERATALAAAGHERARATAAICTAYQARNVADPERAVASLATMTPLRDEYEIIYYAFAMSDLGRPEFVDAPVDPSVTNEVVTRAGGQYVAQALWLRGEVPPKIALALGSELAAASDEQQVPHVQISTNAVLTFVALAAGDPRAARRFCDTATQVTSRTASTLAHTFAALADAACTLVERDEESAAPLVARALEMLPIERWPPRPYLYSLPLVYGLVPEVRAVIDGCAFGPSLSIVRDAARALVALRVDDDPTPAAALPWERADLLRAHVLPPQLAELAAAAATAGDGRVGPVLAELPDRRETLERAADSTPEPVSAWIRSHVARLPARPAYDLHIDMLGAVELFRGRTLVTDPNWTGRDRVRQLMCHLMLHGRVGRRRVAADVWPDLPIEKALSNLRVNLSHLQRVVQPDRDRSMTPWFVRTEGDTIMIGEATMTDDVTAFEEACRAGRAFDDQARTGRAIESYQRAIDLYQGPYLQEWADAEWAEAERLRLHALANAARCRLGELLLARGEPEASADHAAAALRDEPLQERAACLLAHALVAQGDRATARRSIESLLDRLADHRLAPERTTEQLARRLGVQPVAGN